MTITGAGTVSVFCGFCMTVENHSPRRTFPTAASPKSTSFTLLLGFGAFVLDTSDIVADEVIKRVICNQIKRRVEIQDPRRLTS